MEIYVNFGLVDVIGKQYVDNCFMTVEEGIIREVGPMAAFPPEMMRSAVDLAGKTVMPGMFNCHICFQDGALTWLLAGGLSF